MRLARCAAVGGLLLALTGGAPGGRHAATERAEIEERYRWDLSDIYDGDALWEADFARAEALLPEAEAFRGKIGEAGESLLAFRRLREEIERLQKRLLAYAGLKSDEDTRVSKYKGMRDRARALGVRIGAALSWADPEIVGVPREALLRFVERTPGLEIYRHDLDDLRRRQEHVLGEKEEKILFLAGDLAGVPRDVHDQMVNADLRFGTFPDETGSEVEMTEARYGLFMRSADRRVREDAFRAYYAGYARYVHASAAALAGAVKRDLFFTRARGYETCAARALDRDNVPVEVLENLIATVSAHLEPVKRYHRIRRRVMGLDTLRHWDLYAPLVPSLDKTIPYDEAVRTIVAGLAPLGAEYTGAAEEGFSGGWIDVYENVGKRSGAYSWGSYATPHPYILMNYEGTMRDLFTLAHEMGHALHTVHASAAQPPVYADYSLFVAEVASTTNEAILMEHLLGQTEDRETRAYLVNDRIQQILGTVYTQVMFTEFEWRIHERVENGLPLTVDLLGDLYAELLDKYAGGEVAYGEESAIGWSRIRHFYRNFYVYKYATGYVAATALARKIVSEEPGARRRYLAFLRAGSSDYPIELLKNAGVDLTRPEAVESTCRLLGELVDELDRLL